MVGVLAVLSGSKARSARRQSITTSNIFGLVEGIQLSSVTGVRRLRASGRRQPGSSHHRVSIPKIVAYPAYDISDENKEWAATGAGDR
jgi:hypothetical protein